jgi:hypothetical protein
VQAQFQDAVRGIPQQRDWQRGEPTAHQTHHLMRPHSHRLVTFTQAGAHLLSRPSGHTKTARRIVACSRAA